MSDYWKLSGIVIVVVGFSLRQRPTLVVVTAGIVTGLFAGLPFYLPEVAPGPGGARPPEGILNMLGRAFADNRLMTLFILTLPAIGLAEKYGLQERAAMVIQRVKAASVGRLQIIYQLFRITMGALGIRLNGHTSFVRPLVFPMSLGAAAAARRESPEDLMEGQVETIKAATSASENYGNFYGQNLSPVQPGILLVLGVMQGLGYAVSVWNLVLYTAPIVVLSFLLGVIQFRLLDRRFYK